MDPLDLFKQYGAVSATGAASDPHFRVTPEVQKQRDMEALNMVKREYENRAARLGVPTVPGMQPSAPAPTHDDLSLFAEYGAVPASLDARPHDPAGVVRDKTGQHILYDQRTDPTNHPDPTGTFGQNVAAGMGRSAMQTWRGAKQLTGNMTQEEVDEANKLDQPLMDTKGGALGNIAGDVAQIALPASDLMKAASVLPKAAALARMGVASGVSAAHGALQPVLTGDTRASNALIAGALGAGGQGAGELLGAVTAPIANTVAKVADPVTKNLAQRAQAFGIPLRRDQLANSKAADYIANFLTKMPFTGGQELADAQKSAYTRYIASKIGEGTDNLKTALADARTRNSKNYTDIWDRNDVVLGRNDIDAMEKVLQSKIGNIDDISDAEGRRVAGWIGNIGDNVTPIEGNMLVLPGKIYQDMRSRLGKINKAGENTTSDQLKFAAGNMKNILDKAANKSLSDDGDAALLATTNRQWANMRALEKMVPVDPSGQPNYGRLANVLKSADKQGFIKDTSDLAEPAMIGQLLKNTLPDSGTADHQMMYKLAGGLSQAAAAGLGFGAPMLMSDHADTTNQVLSGIGSLGALLAAGRMGNRYMWGKPPVPGLKALAGAIESKMPSVGTAPSTAVDWLGSGIKATAPQYWLPAAEEASQRPMPGGADQYP